MEANAAEIARLKKQLADANSMAAAAVSAIKDASCMAAAWRREYLQFLEAVCRAGVPLEGLVMPQHATWADHQVEWANARVAAAEALEDA